LASHTDWKTRPWKITSASPRASSSSAAAPTIARALTKRLCAARAHTVVLCGRNQQLLDESAEEAKDYGASRTDTVFFDAEDVTNAAHVVSDAFEKAGATSTSW